MDVWHEVPEWEEVPRDEFERDLARADRAVRGLLWLALVGAVVVVFGVVYAVIRSMGWLP